MKFTVKRPVEIDIRFVDISFPVDSDDLENNDDLIDLAEDNTVRLRVDIDTGTIQDFRGNPGTDYSISVKVCDSGSYQLIAPDYSVIEEIVEDYVPNDLIPGSYGDYIELEIDGSTGRITNWPRKPNVSEFFPDDEE